MKTTHINTHLHTFRTLAKFLSFPKGLLVVMSCLRNGVLGAALDRWLQGRLLTYEMVTGEKPENDEDSPAVDEATLFKAVTRETFFVDFMRTDEFDEDGVSRSRVLSERIYLCLLAKGRRKAVSSYATSPSWSLAPSSFCASGAQCTMRAVSDGLEDDYHHQLPKAKARVARTRCLCKQHLKCTRRVPISRSFGLSSRRSPSVTTRTSKPTRCARPPAP